MQYVTAVLRVCFYPSVAVVFRVVKIYFAVFDWFSPRRWHVVCACPPELCPLTVTDVICRSGEQPSAEAEAGPVE